MKLAEKLISMYEKKVEFSVGDEVAISRKFLKSIADHSHASGSARGVIKKFDKLGDIKLAVVDWKKGSWSEKINVNNLVLKSKIGLEDR